MDVVHTGTGSGDVPLYWLSESRSAVGHPMSMIRNLESFVGSRENCHIIVGFVYTQNSASSPSSQQNIGLQQRIMRLSISNLLSAVSLLLLACDESQAARFNEIKVRISCNEDFSLVPVHPVVRGRQLWRNRICLQGKRSIDVFHYISHFLSRVAFNLQIVVLDAGIHLNFVETWWCHS